MLLNLLAVSLVVASYTQASVLPGTLAVVPYEFYGSTLERDVTGLSFPVVVHNTSRGYSYSYDFEFDDSGGSYGYVEYRPFADGKLLELYVEINGKFHDILPQWFECDVDNYGFACSQIIDPDVWHYEMGDRLQMNVITTNYDNQIFQVSVNAGILGWPALQFKVSEKTKYVPSGNAYLQYIRRLDSCADLAEVDVDFLVPYHANPINVRFGDLRELGTCKGQADIRSQSSSGKMNVKAGK